MPEVYRRALQDSQMRILMGPEWASWPPLGPSIFVSLQIRLQFDLTWRRGKHSVACPDRRVGLNFEEELLSERGFDQQEIQALLQSEVVRFDGEKHNQTVPSRGFAVYRLLELLPPNEKYRDLQRAESLIQQGASAEDVRRTLLDEVIVRHQALEDARPSPASFGRILGAVLVANFITGISCVIVLSIMHVIH